MNAKKELVHVTRVIHSDGTVMYYLPSGYVGNIITVSEGPGEYAEASYLKTETAKSSPVLRLDYTRVSTDEKLENLVGGPKPR